MFIGKRDVLIYQNYLEQIDYIIKEDREQKGTYDA